MGPLGEDETGYDMGGGDSNGSGFIASHNTRLLNSVAASTRYQAVVEDSGQVGWYAQSLYRDQPHPLWAAHKT